MSEKRITWKIEKRKISDLKPHPKNPRQFTDKGMDDLEKSIDSIGFAQPVNINQENTILSGHARIKKLEEMGYNEVDVYVPDRTLTPKQEEEIIVRMNANTAGIWDMEKLANEFDLPELEEWGLDIPDLDSDEPEPLEDEVKLQSEFKVTCRTDDVEDVIHFFQLKLKETSFENVAIEINKK